MKNKSVHKMVKAAVRERAIQDGFNDGRFKTRSVQDKRYKKPKYKHQKLNNSDE